jgi:ribosomal protein L37AE/L43A
MEQSSNLIPLQICPACHGKFLILNEANDQYECLLCGVTFFRATVDKYNQQVQAEKDAFSELTKKKTRAWFGNQYYDSERKKWRDGRRPKRIGLGRNKWLWIVLLFIVVSLAITLLLNYFHPGSSFAFFVW